jgi:phosphate-selective porin OprO/OprP
LNTGVIESDHSTHIGYEIYYRHKNLMLGSEALVHNFYSDKVGNHQFYGGDVVVSYFFTGAVRPYNSGTAIFGFVPVKKSVFKGGMGEIEGVVRVSTLNLNDKSIQGGQFWRITPMVNWYMSRIVRFELVYGYGVLDRFGIKGPVQFFETRIQFTVM